MDESPREESTPYDDLTEVEREQLDQLPRERIPPPALEQRTIAALRERGLIRRRGPWSDRHRPWLVAAAAAGVALFLAGVAVGQSVGARQTAEALAALYPDRADRAAARVQSAGTAHAQALDALVRAAANADTREREQAREVAQATLWAAAAEVVRLAPDDPLAVRILQEFERARAEGTDREDGARSVIWF